MNQIVVTVHLTATITYLATAIQKWKALARDVYAFLVRLSCPNVKKPMAVNAVTQFNIDKREKHANKHANNSSISLCIYVQKLVTNLYLRATPLLYRFCLWFFSLLLKILTEVNTVRMEECVNAPLVRCDWTKGLYLSCCYPASRRGLAVTVVDHFLFCPVCFAGTFPCT